MELWFRLNWCGFLCLITHEITTLRRSAERRGRATYRVRAVDDLDDVLDVDVVLLRVQSQSRAVVLPAVDRLVAHRQHLPVHVQHLQDAPAVTARTTASLSGRRTD